MATDASNTSQQQRSIESLADFVAEMSEVRCIGEELTPIIWFRGHGGSAWELLPGVLRRGFRDRTRQYTINPNNDPAQDDLGLEKTEQLINEQFRRTGATLLPTTIDAVDVYFLAQHHGLPTRLLDWTPNPLAALFFAAVERPTEDGEVVALVIDWRLSFGDARDPLRSQLPQPPLSQRDPLVVETIRYLFNEGPRPTRAVVLPLRPDLRTTRMLQQDACFTLHIPGARAIQELPSNSKRYWIPSGCKPKLLAELDSVGINWATLYRDLDHVSKQIKHSWGFADG